jgi:hypothetical protein
VLGSLSRGGNIGNTDHAEKAFLFKRSSILIVAVSTHARISG